MLPQKIRNLPKKIERFLWQRGFRNPAVRRLAMGLLGVSAGLMVAGVVLLPLTSGVFWLGVGASLSAWNFCSLADFVQRVFPVITMQTTPTTAKTASELSSTDENGPEDAKSNKKSCDGKPTNGAASRFFLQGQLFRSYFRLFITGILVYTALVVCRANPFALAAGLSAAVVAMPMLILVWPAQKA